MPEMDGYELCRKVRADPRTRDLPFIFYTATYTGDTDRRFALELGADMFIIKPAEPEALLAVAERILSRELPSTREGADGLAREGVFAEIDRGMDDTAFIFRHERAIAHKLDEKLHELDVTNALLDGERDYVEAVMDSILDPIGVIRSDGTLKGANRAWLLGAADGFGIGGFPAALGERLRPEDCPDAGRREACEACLAVAAGHSPSYRDELGSADGMTWYMVRAVPLRTGGGAVLSMVDISHRKSAELEATRHAAKSEALLHELFHRVGNSLQVVSSLMGIYGDRVGDEAARLLRKIDTRVQALRMVQDKLYEADALDEINVRDYVNDLFMFLNGNREGRSVPVRLELYVPPLMFDLDTLMPLGLVQTELICNALAYAFEDRTGGVIGIALARDPGGTFEMTVEDDGNGGLSTVAEHPGMSGLRIARELMEHQLKGTLELAGGAAGSRCTLRWPGRPAASPR